MYRGKWVGVSVLVYGGRRGDRGSPGSGPGCLKGGGFRGCISV